MTERVTQETLPEFEAFLQSHPKGHFAQSYAWSKQKPLWHWEAIVCRGQDGKIKGAISVLIRRVTKLPYTMVYSCRGPVCDPDDHETLRELIEAVKALAKEYRAYVFKIDPDIPSSNESFVDAMHALGFRSKEGGKGFEAIQPRYVFRLDVAGKTNEELMAQFHQKWRYNIRLAYRKGVEIRICGQEMIPAFAELMLVTGVRDGFVTRDPSYFSNMLKNLGEHVRLYMAFYQGQPIAGTIAIWYGDKVWYLYGASSNEHRNLMPNYALQWEMIQWATEKGCRLYDFRGVPGLVPEDHPLYGLVRFKQGFGGEYTEFVGEMDLVLKPVIYACAEKGFEILRHLRAKAYLHKHRDKKTDHVKGTPRTASQ